MCTARLRRANTSLAEARARKQIKLPHDAANDGCAVVAAFFVVIHFGAAFDQIDARVATFKRDGRGALLLRGFDARAEEDEDSARHRQDEKGNHCCQECCQGSVLVEALRFAETLALDDCHHASSYLVLVRPPTCWPIPAEIPDVNLGTLQL
jgi:hypothetical protein